MGGYKDNLTAAVARAEAAEKKLKELKGELREGADDEFQDLDSICPPPEFFSFKTWMGKVWSKSWPKLPAILAVLILVWVVAEWVNALTGPEPLYPPPTVERFEPGPTLYGALQSEYETNRYHETCSDHRRTLMITARAETAVVVVRVWRRGTSDPLHRLVFHPGGSPIQHIFVGPGCTRFAAHGYNTLDNIDYPASSSRAAGLVYELRVAEGHRSWQ